MSCSVATQAHLAETPNGWPAQCPVQGQNCARSRQGRRENEFSVGWCLHLSILSVLTCRQRQSSTLRFHSLANLYVDSVILPSNRIGTYNFCAFGSLLDLESANMSSASYIFPCEVLDIVAHHLVDSGAFASCANLNATSHAVYDTTLKTLWTFMFWMACHEPNRYSEKDVEEKWAVFEACPGAKRIRQASAYRSILDVCIRNY